MRKLSALLLYYKSERASSGEGGSVLSTSVHQWGGHLEVGRVYPQLVGVQRLQRSQRDGQLADVFGPLRDRQHDLLPVREQVSGAVADVQVGEVGLGTGIRGEHPADGSGNTGNTKETRRD